LALRRSVLAAGSLMTRYLPNANATVLSITRGGLGNRYKAGDVNDGPGAATSTPIWTGIAMARSRRQVLDAARSGAEKVTQRVILDIPEVLFDLQLLPGDRITVADVMGNTPVSYQVSGWTASEGTRGTRTYRITCRE
jgi:hypothetical protein